MTAVRTLLSLLLWISSLRAGEVFIEAESFSQGEGWRSVLSSSTRSASGTSALSGASGPGDAVASTIVAIKDAGRYQLWVRFSSHPTYRGPFRVTVLAGDRELGSKLFDTEPVETQSREPQVWQSFPIDLPEGEVTLQIKKHENKNCSGITRLIDCFLLTMDGNQVPNHLHFGAQTYLRVTLGEGYERPAYLHVFADHFHAPWYQHYALARSGAVAGLRPEKEDLLLSGESTAWCNLTPMIYQDSGAMLHITARHSYTDYAERLRATFEFATAPDERSIVRTMRFDNQPGTVAIFAPPNLLTKENLALMKTDREIAEANGRLADSHRWPTHGRALGKFPFFVTAALQNRFTPRETGLLAREQKTLDYFGFTPGHLRHIGGAWLMKDKSYCHPDLEKMKVKIEAEAARFREEGGKVEAIVFAELTDEPTGQPLDFIATDPAYLEGFPAWLRARGETPESLLVSDWESVRPVSFEQRHQFPALYYFSQRFRTRALGDFMAVQRGLLEKAYGGTFPVLVNFSDGAVYTGNFYTQGVDYFELLDAPDQNAIWGEDWSNGASTYQCASYNVDLMRAAARERGQVIGHHLVAHAGRKAWDVKLKATSEVARGVKILNNFAYGPTWATHEGGPYWRSSVWQGKPETWTANASLTREIGAVEDLLLTAMPAPAKVALLYSSASDAWTLGENFAYGFDRMHTWLALSHAQTPVDVVHEAQVSKGQLEDYEVCYLSGPHLTRSAAAKLGDWVEAGGTLWITAGGAERDEYNQALGLLEGLHPATRGQVEVLQKHLSSGRYLSSLAAKDTVKWEGGEAEVLSVKQDITPPAGSEVLATFGDGSPALARVGAGRGKIYYCGFLPALSYIKPALEHRATLQKKVDEGGSLSEGERAEVPLLERSANPWKFPSAIRDLLLTPVREAGIAPPIHCNTALVDAVFMPHEDGILVPLANYTNESIADLHLRITVPRPIARVESAVRGPIPFRPVDASAIELNLPLENNDFVKLVFGE